MSAAQSESNRPSGDPAVDIPVRATGGDAPEGAATVPSYPPPYLSLISAKKDYKNPNPLGVYSRDPNATDGKDVWIVILDAGFDLDRWPQELSSTDSSRTIKTFVPPPEILHYRYMLEDPTKICNVNISDCADPDYETGKPRGHGTAIAIMAAGAKSGVAPKANLYLAKTSMTASSRETGRIEQHSVHPWAVTYTLRYIIRAIDEGLLPLGKTVLCIPFSFHLGNLRDIYPHRYGELADEFSAILESLSRQGVTVVLKSGTRRLLDRTAASNLDYLPQCLSGPERDYILVGGTTAEGRPVTGTLASVPDCPVDVYAQAEGAQRGLVQPEGGGADGGAMWRNCIGFAAGQVAGLAAYFLSHPDYEEYFKFSHADKQTGNTVGWRMKKLLKALSYQRVADDDKLDKAMLDDYDVSSVPKEINVVYNGVHSPQK